MFKNFLSVMLLAVAMILVGGQNFASAKDVYVGTYLDGRDAYLMTDTISNHRDERYDDGKIVYECRVKAVYSNSNDVTYIDYKFWPDPMPHFINSKAEGGNYLLNQAENPIEWKIFQYLIHNES